MIYKIEVDSAGYMLDKNGISTGILKPSYNFEEYNEKETVDLVNLITAGLSADDLTKLKANGVI